MKKFPLNLFHLKYFLDAVKLESVSASAEINHVSQSAISQAINKLEEELGCQLLNHQPKRFKVTDEGKKLYESSKEVFQAIQKAEESFSTEVPQSIKFACTHSFAVTFLPDLLKTCKKHLPQVQLNCRLEHANTIIDWVKKGILDFGILLDNIDLSPFECEEIYRGEYRLYVAKKCKDASDLSFMLDSEERIETNLLKKAYKKRYGKELPVFIEMSSWEVIADLAEKGLGIGFFPDYVASNRKETLKLYSEEIVNIPYRIYALFSRSYVRKSSVDTFLELFAQLK